MLCGETDAVRLRALAVVVWIVLVACCIWADGLTVEALVIEDERWHGLFTDEELQRARKRLKDYQYEPKAKPQPG